MFTKSLITTLLMTAGMSSAHATLLITGTRQPGFEANAQSKTFELDSSGKMTETILDYATNRTTVLILGTLSADTVAKITLDINGIAQSAQLMDEQAGQPLCTDTPSYSVHVTRMYKGRSQDVEVMRSAACHDWSLDTRGGSKEAELARAFLNY